MHHGGGVVRHRGGGVLDGRGVRDGGGVVGHRSDYLGDRSDDLSDMTKGFPVHDGVETVVGVGGVLNSALGAVGVHHGVGALHNVSIAGLVLALGVTGVSVLHVVGEAVLGVGIVSLNLGNGGSVCHGGRDLGYRSRGVVGRSGLDMAGVGERSGVRHLGSGQEASTGNGQQAGQDDKLKKEQK